MSRNGNGSTTLDTSNMLRGAAGYQPGGEQQDKDRLDLWVTKEEMNDAIRTDFEEYVEPNGRRHLMDNLGWIDPRFVINIKRHRNRKVRASEIMLMGGPDGNDTHVCEVMLGQVMNEEGVETFDQLRQAPNYDELRKRFEFKAHWGLHLTVAGAVAHLLNVMSKKVEYDDFGLALLSVRSEQVVLLGNKFVVRVKRDGQEYESEAMVSGKFWFINRAEGGVFEEAVTPWGQFARELRADNIVFDRVPVTLDADKFLVQLLEARKQKDEVRRQHKTGAVQSLKARLLGKSDDLAKAAPIT